MSDLENILKTSAWYFPFILPFFSYFLGLNELAFYLVLDFVIINPFLKGLLGLLGLQSKRPSSECLDLSDFTCYGMPSGHTEIHWVLLSYIVVELVKKYRNGERISTKLIIGASLVAILTMIVMWQRWITERHTPLQILIGAIIGTMLGIFFNYYISK